jgi:hypothetical protein
MRSEMRELRQAIDDIRTRQPVPTRTNSSESESDATNTISVAERARSDLVSPIRTDSLPIHRNLSALTTTNSTLSKPNLYSQIDKYVIYIRLGPDGACQLWLGYGSPVLYVVCLGLSSLQRSLRQCYRLVVERQILGFQDVN